MLLLEPNTSTWPSLPLDGHLPEPMLISKKKKRTFMVEINHGQNRTKGVTAKLGNICGLMEDMVVCLCCCFF